MSSKAATAAVANAKNPIGAAVTAALNEEERKVEALVPSRMNEAEYQRPIFVCTAAEGVLPMDLERPDFWAHVATRLSRWTRLEVRADNGNWYAELVVLDSGRNWATVKLLATWDFTRPDYERNNQAIAAEYIGRPYEVAFRGEHELWSVIRKSDRAVMVEKLGTKDAADKWVVERMKADHVPA